MPITLTTAEQYVALTLGELMVKNSANACQIENLRETCAKLMAEVGRLTEKYEPPAPAATDDSA